MLLSLPPAALPSSFGFRTSPRRSPIGDNARTGHPRASRKVEAVDPMVILCQMAAEAAASGRLTIEDARPAGSGPRGRGQPTAASGSTVRGLAVPFGTVAWVGHHESARRSLARFHPDAFDQSLASIAAGGQGCTLLVEHDLDRCLAGTRDGSLIVAKGPDGVLWSLNMATPRGRAAAAFIRANPDLRHCSPGFAPQPDPRRLTDLTTCYRAILSEISLTAHPAFLGTWVAVA